MKNSKKYTEEKLVQISKAESSQNWSAIESKLEEQTLLTDAHKVNNFLAQNRLLKIGSLAACIVIIAVSAFAFQSIVKNKTLSENTLENEAQHSAGKVTLSPNSTSASTAEENAALQQGSPANGSDAQGNNSSQQSTPVTTSGTKNTSPQIALPIMPQSKEMSISEIENLLGITIVQPQSLPNGMTFSKALIYYSTDSNGNMIPYYAELKYTGDSDKTLSINFSKPQDVQTVIVTNSPDVQILPYPNYTISPVPAIKSTTIPTTTAAPTTIIPQLGAPSAVGGSLPAVTASTGGTGGTISSGSGSTGTVEPYIVQMTVKNINSKDVQFTIATETSGKIRSVFASFEQDGVNYDISSSNIEIAEIEAMLATMIK